MKRLLQKPVLISLVLILVLVIRIININKETIVDKVKNKPTVTPANQNIISNETTKWITCENKELNLQVKIPPKWQCLINKYPDISEHNIYLYRPDGKYIAFLDVYPADISSPFSPIPQAAEGYIVGTIKINNISKKIYIWPQRTQLSPIFEQFIYDEKKHEKDYLQGIFYLVADPQIKQLTKEEKNDLQNILSSVELIKEY